MGRHGSKTSPYTCLQFSFVSSGDLAEHHNHVIKFNCDLPTCWSHALGLRDVTGCNREKKTMQKVIADEELKPNSPEGRRGVLMSTFLSLYYRTKVLNKPFPSLQAFLRGSKANGHWQNAMRQRYSPKTRKIVLFSPTILMK